jgi:phosphoglycerate dehydrogenase-like enzyme
MSRTSALRPRPGGSNSQGAPNGSGLDVLLMNPPSAEHLAALQAAAPGARFSVARSEPEATRLIARTEVVLGNRYFLQALPYARRLRWMQSNSVGVDLILRGAGERLRNAILTNARGVYDDEVADHALALILGLVRGLHLARDAQRERRWDRWSLGTLAGRQALVLGWGGVGQAIARRLGAFGVEVQGARRTHQGPPTQAGGCLVHGPETWRQVLPGTSILVAALPLTPETHHLVGRAEIAALPTGAVVVNVGRGGTLDDGALLAALGEGRLIGAGLDVMADEPLSPDHPAWDEPRLLLTPHVARSLEQPPYRWESLFVENLRRYAAGEPLLHVVDQEAGY